MSRLLLVPLALLLLLVVATVVLLPRLVSEDQLLALAAAALHQQTGATLTVDGDTKISLFPALGVALTDAAITLPDRQQPDLRVRSLHIGVRLLPLLKRRIDVDTISLDGLRVRIDAAQERSGETAAAPDIAAGAGAALAVPLALNVQRLIVTDSRLEWVDSTPSAETTVLELVKLEASGLNLAQQPIPIELQLRRPGEKPLDLNVNGTVRVDQQVQHITLDTLVAVLSGATAKPVTVQTSGTIDLGQEIAKLELTLELGEMRGQGNLRYASADSPRLTTHLRLNQFDPALLALAGPQAAATAKTQTPTNANAPLPLDALRLIDTHAVLDIETARWSEHTVNDLHVDLRGVGGKMEVPELSGTVYGGMLKASAALDARSNTATFTTSGSLSGLDIATALAATDSRPLLAGNATLNWQLNSRGRTANEMTAALRGPIELTTENAVLQGTSVEKLLCQSVALSNQETLTAAFPESSHFHTLAADIQLADGKASLNPLRAELTGITLSGTGRFDLLKRDFDATFKARLSPQLDQLDPACRVSKRMLAIDWPINCTGSAATEPAKWCSVDATKILQDLTVKEGREKLEEKAGKLLDKLFNRQGS